jgi:hypothetical protein
VLPPIGRSLVALGEEEEMESHWFWLPLRRRQNQRSTCRNLL